MSHQPPPEVEASETAPGPPVPLRDTSLTLDAAHPSNPFQVDFVIPYDLSAKKGENRAVVQEEMKEGYERLLRALEGEGGLKVASRSKPAKKDKGGQEVWVFVSIGEEKLAELVERET